MPPLQTVEPQRLYRQIAEQLRRLMLAGEFAPGARLPAERELAQQLGVSRPSVREALIALEVEGWVEIRIGSGVYARARPAENPANAGPTQRSHDWGPLEVIRARRLVESEIAAQAAPLATASDLLAIEDALAHMRSLASQGTMPTEADRAFHLAVAAAAHNTVLTDTVGSFWEARSGPLFTRLGGFFETPRAWNAAIREHQKLLDALHQRDANAARSAMQAHLDKSHARLNASWHQSPPESAGDLPP